jgi:hypothetical protein
VFFRDAAEQRIILDSHTRSAAVRPLRLARRFDVAASTLSSRIEAHSHTTKRPGLARLLLSLADAAGYQTISTAWCAAPLVDQVTALWHAARRVELEGGSVDVLSAYAHPIAAEAHLMLVDSELHQPHRADALDAPHRSKLVVGHPPTGAGIVAHFERRTLAQVRSLQAWLAAKKGIRLTIEKPLFDMGLAAQCDRDGPVRPCCIPDFVVRRKRSERRLSHGDRRNDGVRRRGLQDDQD